MMVCVLGHPSRLASLAPQRLCWPSSVLPFSVVPEDSIEDGEELSGDCDESDHFGLSGRPQAMVEGPRAGLQRIAVIAAMNSAVRTLLRPPPMKLLPRHLPD